VSPVFAHGQLRLYLLALLAEAPRHGYEIIQDLEARFGGLYTPSAGTVYPRLAKLEEEGLVARSDEGRKATYRITEAGLAEVRSRRDEVEGLQADLDRSARRLADQVRAQVQGRSADLRAELRAAARQARATARPAGGATGGADSGPRATPGAPWAPDASWMPETSWVPGQHWTHGASFGSSADGSDWAELERAAYEVRDQARAAWRRHGVTAAQAAALLEILTDASRRIAEVMRQPPAR